MDSKVTQDLTGVNDREERFCTVGLLLYLRTDVGGEDFRSGRGRSSYMYMYNMYRDRTGRALLQYM